MRDMATVMNWVVPAVLNDCGHDVMRDPMRTQSISRAMEIVMLVRRGNITGLRLQDILNATGLSKSTAHRLLQELIANGLLRKLPHGRYKLGRFSYELGLAASFDYNVLDLCGPALDRITSMTGDSVFLAIRSGNDSLCIDKRIGRSGLGDPFGPPKGFLQPLGVGACGLAILSALPDTLCDSIIKANSVRLAAYDEKLPAALPRLVEETRRAGYAYTGNFAAPGISAIGVTLLDRIGRPMAAMSVATKSVNMSADHRHEIFLALSDVGKELRERLLANYASILLLT